VICNLVGNAWKFTARKERARIEIGRTAGADGNPVMFVRDNGAGFDMAYASRMFEAFQRLHACDEFEGTGIGLAIVHRVIARHGGRIWADAAPQQGASFYFTLGQATG
jgi:light-regulated signal transduction histidine kinase (bacteriophytochrome)